MRVSPTLALLRELRRPLASLCVVLLAANVFIGASLGLAGAGSLCVAGAVAYGGGAGGEADAGPSACPFCTAAAAILPEPHCFNAPSEQASYLPLGASTAAPERAGRLLPIGARAPPVLAG